MKAIPETEAKLSEIGGPTSSPPARDVREASLAALHGLTERLTARQNGVVVFERETSSEIDRDLM